MDLLSFAAVGDRGVVHMGVEGVVAVSERVLVSINCLYHPIISSYHMESWGYEWNTCVSEGLFLQISILNNMFLQNEI